MEQQERMRKVFSCWVFSVNIRRIYYIGGSGSRRRYECEQIMRAEVNKYKMGKNQWSEFGTEIITELESRIMMMKWFRIIYSVINLNFCTQKHSEK